jgi:hypothetical protein
LAGHWLIVLGCAWCVVEDHEAERHNAADGRHVISHSGHVNHSHYSMVTDARPGSGRVHHVSVCSVDTPRRDASDVFEQQEHYKSLRQSTLPANR